MAVTADQYHMSCCESPVVMHCHVKVPSVLFHVYADMTTNSSQLTAGCEMTQCNMMLNHPRHIAQYSSNSQAKY